MSDMPTPDETLAEGLIDSANALAARGGSGKPEQADLRRASSTAYYAVFHALARMCADVLVGSDETRPNKAWVEVYRGLNHGTVRTACTNAQNVAFPPGIKQFSRALELLQKVRHAADYDPTDRLTRVSVNGSIKLAEESIAALDSVARRDKIAFATWVLVTSKGAQDARKRARTGNGSL